MKSKSLVDSIVDIDGNRVKRDCHFIVLGDIGSGIISVYLAILDMIHLQRLQKSLYM